MVDVQNMQKKTITLRCSLNVEVLLHERPIRIAPRDPRDQQNTKWRTRKCQKSTNARKIQNGVRVRIRTSRERIRRVTYH